MTNELILRIDTNEITTVDDWREYGKRINKADGSLNWIMGDWLLAHQKEWGKMYDEAQELTGWKYGQLADCKNTANHFSERSLKLEWSHHYKIYKLDKDNSDYWLSQAEVNNWSVRELTEAIKLSKQHSNNGQNSQDETSQSVYYTIEQWQSLSQQEKDFLLAQDGNSKFNPTNDNIEWARYSWNPITGCLHNCAYCYARDIANRFYQQKFEPSFLPDRLTAPQNTKQKDLSQFDNPVDKMGYRNVFTCSMADLFGKWVPTDWIQAVLKSITDNPQWTFLLLTKFPVRMAEFDYPENVWLGTSVDYQWAVERAEKAFVKIKNSGFNGVCWLSCEPMMERLTFNSLEMFDWVVMGGSSKSTQTPEYFPPFDDIVHLHNQARNSGCKIYQKTNLIQRMREYPMESYKRRCM